MKSLSLEREGLVNEVGESYETHPSSQSFCDEVIMMDLCCLSTEGLGFKQMNETFKLLNSYSIQITFDFEGKLFFWRPSGQLDI